MPLLQLRQVTLKYSSAPLLDEVDFQVEAGERICLLGRNGAGKTSLMRIITGEETPNEGEIIRPDAAVMTRLIQEIPTTSPARSPKSFIPASVPTVTRKSGKPTSAWRNSWPKWVCPQITNFPPCRAG